MAWRTVSSGWVWTSGGSGRVARRQQVRPTVAPGGPQEPVVGHPPVVVDLRQIAPPRVGDVHHDHRVGPEVAPDHQRGRDGGAARAAEQQPLLPRHPPGGGEAVGVGDRHHPVDDRGVVGGRPEVLADALDQIGAPRPPRVDRPLGVGPDDLDGGVALLEVAADPGDRAAGADAGHEVGHPAALVCSQISGPVVLVLGSRVVGVVVLVGLPRPGDLDAAGGPTPSSRSRGDPGPPRSGTRPPRRRRPAAGRSCRSPPCRADEDAAVPAPGGDDGQPDSGVARSSARRWSRPGGAARRARRRSIMASAGRSFDEPPGLNCSSLATRVHSRSRAVRSRRTMGVRPMRSTIVSATSMGGPVSVTGRTYTPSRDGLEGTGRVAGAEVPEQFHRQPGGVQLGRHPGPVGLVGPHADQARDAGSDVGQDGHDRRPGPAARRDGPWLRPAPAAAGHPPRPRCPRHLLRRTPANGADSETPRLRRTPVPASTTPTPPVRCPDDRPGRALTYDDGAALGEMAGDQMSRPGSSSGGSCSAQIACAFQHRVRNRHPDGGTPDWGPRPPARCARAASPAPDREPGWPTAAPACTGAAGRS